VLRAVFEPGQLLFTGSFVHHSLVAGRAKHSRIPQQAFLVYPRVEATGR